MLFSFGFLGGGAANTARTQAFLTATGISDATIISALNAMDNSLISAGLLPSGTGAGKIKVLYPFVGGTAATHKFNFVNPADTDSAFRLTFFGGWTHSATGALPNGTNAYANTFINWNTHTNLNDVSFGCYWRDIVLSGSGGYYGCFDGVNLVLVRNQTSCDYYINDTGGVTIQTLFVGLHSATRLNNTQVKLAVNGVGALLSKVSSGKPNVDFWLGGSNTFTSFNNSEIALFFQSDGLSDAENVSFYNIVQTFQTVLNRQV